MATTTVRTTCPYCGVGCGVLAQTDGTRLIAVQGDPDHPANHGRLCVKGTALPDTQVEDGRLLQPLIDGQPVSWESALDHTARGLREVIDQHGPDAVAFYLSGQLLTEDYYVANKLMKGFIGSANVDTNSRLCMASAVAAHKRAFGEDVVPCSYQDLDTCDLIILVGSNAAWTHPVLYQRIAARHAAGELRVVVIDPRRTATCEIADLHLEIRPGMDAALFNALLADLSARGAIDQAFIDTHTRGFSAALASAEREADDAARLTGINAGALKTFFDWFADSERTVTFYSQGVNQASNGTDKANAIINTHLATGRIGRPGMGPFSITGQPNAMGGREVGGMANQLAAHQDFEQESIDAVGRFWQAPNMVSGPGRKAVEMFEAVASGEIRAIWIMGTNPAVSLPDSAMVGKALADCPLVIVSDCMAETETTAYADVLLPAQGWGEKDGTVTNSERRISRQRGFLSPVGEAKPDWWILSEVAGRLGYGSAFGYQSSAQIFREHAVLTGSATPARLLDISSLGKLSDDDYRQLTPWQWGEPFREFEFSTADGRARFVPIAPHEPVQQPSTEQPFILTTGRLRDQWHTMTRTGLAPGLLKHTDTPLVDMHPRDAERLGLTGGELIELGNSGGHLRAIVNLSDGVQPGQLFAPIHWNGRYASPCRVSDLLRAVTDPISGQPESKHGVVQVSAPATGCWLRYVGGALSELERSELERSELERPELERPELERPELERLDLAGRELFRTTMPGTAGQRTEIATRPDCDRGAMQVSLEAGHFENLILLSTPTLLSWVIEADGVPVWAGALAERRHDLPAWEALEARLEKPAGAPWQQLGDLNTVSRSRQICTCFEVDEDAIRSAICRGAGSVQALGRTLGCGTNCGSCLPELSSLVRELGAAQEVTAITE